MSWKTDLPRTDDHWNRLIDLVDNDTRFSGLIPNQIAERILHKIIFKSKNNEVKDRILDNRQIQDLIGESAEEYRIWAERVGLVFLTSYAKSRLEADIKNRLEEMKERAAFTSFTVNEIAIFEKRLVEDFTILEPTFKADLYEKLASMSANHNDLEKALYYRNQSSDLDPDRNLKILDLILKPEKNLEDIKELLDMNTPRSKSVALAFVDRMGVWEQYKEFDWSGLSSVGNELIVYRNNHEWEKLRTCIDGLNEVDLQNMSTLYTAALSHLLLCLYPIDAENLIVPPETLPTVTFNLQERERVETAQRLFSRFIQRFAQTELDEDIKLRAEDFLIWLFFSDPENQDLFNKPEFKLQVQQVG